MRSLVTVGIFGLPVPQVSAHGLKVMLGFEPKDFLC